MELHQIDCLYRVSAKALVLNDKSEILLCQEHTGVWDLPGGGIDHGETPHQALKREVMEEMGVEVLEIAKRPTLFLSVHTDLGYWGSNVLYQTKLANLDITPSNECQKVAFYSLEQIANLNTTQNVQEMRKQMIKNQIF